MLPSPSSADSEKAIFSPHASAEGSTSKQQEYAFSPPNRTEIPETEQEHEKPELKRWIGPHPHLPIKTVLYGDVSNDNILAFATDAVLRKTVATSSVKNLAVVGWLDQLQDPPITNKRKKSQQSVKDQKDTIVSAHPTSTVYICDLDRPWRPFPVFQVPDASVALLKFSPCGRRLVICDASGGYHLLVSKHSALNAWHLLHTGQCPSNHKFIYATWTKSPQTFLFNPTHQSDGFLNLPGRPKIVAIQDSRHDLEHDGFMLITDKALLTVVFIEKETNGSSEFIFPTYKGVISEGDTEFAVADTVFDVDENSFYLTLASSSTPDVTCVKFDLSPYADSKREGSSVSGSTITFEESTSFTGRNIFQRLKLIISSKVKYLLAATKAFDNDYLELWELSTSSDLQRDFLDSFADPAIVPADKPAWSMNVNQALTDGFLTWSLPSERFVTNDIDKSFTASVAGRNGSISFYTVKLGLEISIVQAGSIEIPQPVQYVRQHGNSVKRVPITPEATCLLTSANGCMVHLVDSGCRVWSFAIPRTLWLINHVPDLLEVLLTVELDFSDVMAATRDAAGTLRILDDVYHGFSLQQRAKSHVRYSKLKMALLEKTKGRTAAIVMSASVFLDVFLTFLEQFVDVKNPDELTSPLIFEIPELQIVLRNEEATFTAVASVIQLHFALDQTVLRALLTGFHLIIGEIVELVALFVANPDLVLSEDNGLTPSPAMESLPKIRLILALIYVWTSSRPTLRQFWQRTPFGDTSKTVMDTLFEATSKMKDPDWPTTVGVLLDEACLTSKNWSRDWKRLYGLSETRMSALPNPDPNRPVHVEFMWNYAFLPASSPGDEGQIDYDQQRMTTSGEPDTETFNLKPTTRKYCSRCFFNCPWRPGPVATEYNAVDSWHSQIRYRWKHRCFCGGAWIFL